nr:hypothetical protein [Tanacetum cinerariifolium]
VSSPYEGRSGDVSPGVNRPPVMPEDPYAYVVAVFQALPPPDYMPGPEEPEQAPPSPTAESPGYISKSDPNEDSKEDDDEDPEEDPADYPDEDDDDEEEEHPASADSIPPPPALYVTARISFKPQPPTLSFTKEDAERFLAMPIPLPSPLTPLSSPLPQIPSPLLPTSPPILPIPLPDASPSLQLLSSDRRADRPEVTLPPRKRLSIVHCPGYAMGESSVAAAARLIEEDIGFGIRDTWIDPRDVVEEEALTTLEGVNTRKMAPKKAAPKRTTRLNPGATSNLNQAPSTTTTTVTNAQLQAMIDQGVNAALAARDANRTGDDSHTSGTGVRRTERWFEKIETVFHISNCLAENQVKFATCTLLAGALTWWNSHVRIVGNDVAYVMTWIELKKKMTDKYYPRNEMKKIETEFWNLEVQGTDKMAPTKAALKRTTRLNPGATSNPNQAPSTTTTSVTNAQLQAMIDQGVNAALAARDANRTGDDSHTSGTGVRRTEHDDQEAAELKRCLEIVPDDEDDVTIDAIPLSSKSPTIIDYKIHKEGRKGYF